MLVSTEQLAADLARPDLASPDLVPDLVVADASWFLPGDGRDARAGYRQAHIPGAVFLDLAGLVDPDATLPMTLPPRDLFVRAVAALGIGELSRVVLYDDSPHHTAARAWAMFRSFGGAAMILDDGLAKWRAEGRPVEAGERLRVLPSLAPPAIGTGGIGIADAAAVADALTTGSAQVVDARSATRFAGEEPEPRPGVVPGHMPGAVNLPYARFFHADGTWKRDRELVALFRDAGVDPDRPVIATCGSGVTASVVAFALDLLRRNAGVYDGSWAEWGSDPDRPKATGRD